MSDATASAQSYITRNGVEIAEVHKIDGPEQERAAIDVTHLRSENNCREKIPGWTDPGTVSLELNFLPENDTQTDLLELLYEDDPTSAFVINWSDGSTNTFNGFVTKHKPAADVDDKQLMLEVELTLTGPVT